MISLEYALNTIMCVITVLKTVPHLIISCKTHKKQTNITVHILCADVFTKLKFMDEASFWPGCIPSPCQYCNV